MLSDLFDRAVEPLGLGDWCERCGGPQGAGVLVVREEPARCERCGLELDGQGRCAWGRREDGEVELNVVLLHGVMARKPGLPN